MRTYKAVCIDDSPLFLHVGRPPLTVGKVYTLRDTAATVLEHPQGRFAPPVSDPDTVTVMDPDPQVTYGRYEKLPVPRSFEDKFGTSELRLVDPHVVSETPRPPTRVLRSRFEVL